MNCILLRYGEIGLKSKRKRPLFEKRYIDAICDALKEFDFSLENLGGRFVILTKDATKIILILQRVPGIQSVSPANKIEFSSKDDLLHKLKEFRNLAKDKTFCMKVRRIGSHDFTSTNFAAESAGVFFDESDGVNLKHPDIKINLEIRDDVCYLFTETIDCLGGLPPASSGKVLCLFSGGLDSPVAAYHMMKRGCRVDFLFINLSGEKEVHDVAQIYNFLIQQYVFGYTPKLFVVDGNEIISKIKSEVPDRLKQIALKIAFYQVAERITKEHNHDAIITGESLSQKSTQTIQSLAVIQSQIETPVLRPLISLDKLEITKTAERIGTFASSQKIKEYCNLAEGPVATTPSMDVLEHIPVFKEIIQEMILLVRKGIVDTEDTAASIEINDFVSVDMRSHKRISLQTDKSIAYPDILDSLNTFTKENTYVIICDFGVRSENIAFLLRKKGISAVGVTTKNFLKIRKKNSQQQSKQEPVKAVQ